VTYLATVIDLASRKVVGWALADHMRTDLVEDALSMAFANRAPDEGVVFHSDRGCHTPARTSPNSPGERRRAVGRPEGRVLGQRSSGNRSRTIKRELIDTRSWPTRQDSGDRSSSTSRAGTTPPAALEPRLPQPVQYEAQLHIVNRQAA